MAKIVKILGREILDSRANPTIETTVFLDSGHLGKCSIPAGASSSKYEAFELRDKDPDRFAGMGVLKAVNHVNQIIAPKVINLNPDFQTKLDQLLIDLDASPDKSNLGANAILSVSIAALKASASSYQLPIYQYLAKKYGLSNNLNKMPTPTFNIINGGAHGAGNLDFQEFHIIPSSRFSYHQALQMGIEIYNQLRKNLKFQGAIHSVGDEGGFAPNLFTNLDALELLVNSIQPTKYKLTQDLFLGLDVSAGFFFKNNQYQIKDRTQPFSRDELINYYQQLNREYHLFSLEDGLEQDDWEGWSELTEKLGDTTLIVGDDLLSTTKERVKKAVITKACNAVLIKPNQIGTVSETIEVVKFCRENDLKIIVSHRSGETNDTFIADLAVGISADYTKFGAPARGERIAKYNRLLEIESELKL
ncbi:MAG: phosphopyruvate hydratase [Patescibacteria group bacterium]|nr:phosphopyruvate hydratase [Patescibacteria group bacterium]